MIYSGWNEEMDAYIAIPDAEEMERFQIHGPEILGHPDIISDFMEYILESMDEDIRNSMSNSFIDVHIEMYGEENMCVVMRPMDDSSPETHQLTGMARQMGGIAPLCDVCCEGCSRTCMDKSDHEIPNKLPMPEGTYISEQLIIVSFDSLDEIAHACHAIPVSVLISKSCIVKYDGRYYLFCSGNHLTKQIMGMAEFGRMESMGAVRQAYIKEHGVMLIKENAVSAVTQIAG